MMKKHGAESLISVINKRTRIFNIVLLFYDTYAAIKKVSIFNKSQKKTQIFWKKERFFSHKTVLTIHIAPLYRNLYCIGKKLSIPSPSLYSISIRCWFVKTKIWKKRYLLSGWYGFQFNIKWNIWFITWKQRPSRSTDYINSRWRFALGKR